MNEFHTLNGTCSTLIPQGPGYENVSLANQVCTTVGSLPGMTTVDGNRFANLSYGYLYSDLWKVSRRSHGNPSLLKCNVPQNYGIICAFGVGFLGLLLLAAQYNTSSTFSSAVTLFKRGSVSPEAVDEMTDEEKTSQPGTATRGTTSRLNFKVTSEKTTTSNDVFTWQHIQYTVPVSGGERRLLDDVSGYVAPGKLTALMGESGAGKVCHLLCFWSSRSTFYHRRRYSMS